MLSLAVLISGGGSNLQALISATQEPGFPARVTCVGSDTNAPGLRHADAAGIPSFIVRPRDYATREAWAAALSEAIRDHGVRSAAEAARLKSDDAGLVVSAGLMRILPAAFVAEYAPRLINTHPALLPSFPGAHAVEDALAARVDVTGVTVHVIDEGVDTGPTLRQERVEILPDDSADTLHERIKQRERPLLVQTVRDIAEGRIVLDPQTPTTTT